MMKILKRLRIYLLIIFISVPSVFSLFFSGLPPTHDGEYHIVRFYEFDKVLNSGVFYPIWAPDMNYTYGSPLFLYVYPLPNYIASFFHAFGASFIDSFKLNLIAASIIGSVGMYAYGRYKFGVWGGILAAISYTYAPYHALDVYVRGSVGEVWALALFPIVLLFFDLGIKKKNIAFSLLSGIIFSLVIFSHNILSVMFFAFLVFYSLFIFWLEKFSKKTVVYLFVPFISGILLSSIFTIPALLEQKYVVGLKVFNVFDHFPEIYQLIIPSWGSGYSGITSGTQMSFQIGLMNLIIILILFIALFRRKIEKNLKRYIIFFFIVFILSTFLITPFSKFLYQIFSFMQLFQFPWRFLSIVIFSSSILVGSITVFYKSKKLYVLLICLIFLTTFSYHKSPYVIERSDLYYISNENFLYGTNSIGNAFQTKWLTQQLKLPNSSAQLDLDARSINVESSLPEMQKYIVDLGSPNALILNTAYFPGWKARVNGEDVKVVNSKGLIHIPLDKGKNNISVYFSDTPIRLLAKIISVATFFLITLILIRKFVTIRT